MREIKFRAWNTKQNRIWKGQNIDWIVDNWTYSNKTTKLMQYTGLKDKNGLEIYEGDVLSDKTETEDGILESKCQVFWNEFTSSWHLDESYCQDKTSSCELWKELNDFEYEIIGNIHENPELIK